MKLQLGDKVRRPIGLKIFGITVGMLILMAAVTYISALHLKKLDRQLTILAEYTIPLDQAISQIRIQHLQQILFLERLIAMNQKQSLEEVRKKAQAFATANAICDRDNQSKSMAKAREAFPAEGERQVAMFEMLRFCGDQEIAAARATVDKALALPYVADDPQQLQKFTKLQVELSAIPPSRAAFNTSISRYLAELQQGEPRSIAIVKQYLETSRRTVNQQTNSISKLLNVYTREMAASASAVEREALIFSWTITAGAAVLGLLFAAILTRNLVRPVLKLLNGAKAVQQGDLTINVQVDSADEIAQLAQSFNFMISGLKEKEAIKQKFGKYIDPRIMKDLLEESPSGPNGEKRRMTVFFSDIEGFTALSEQLTPNNVLRLINHYLSAMSRLVQSNKGIIDKYIGDAVMAFWGPPFTEENEHAVLACYSALDQMEMMDEFRMTLPDIIGLRKGLPNFHIRIGICTGDVIVGEIGSDVTKNYTVIGDTVNLASRLEALNKHYGTRIIIGEETWAMAKEAIAVRELDLVRVVGKQEPVRVFELMGRSGSLDQNRVQLCKYFEDGLRAYRNREWAVATESFGKCLAIAPDDAPSRMFIARIAGLSDKPPAVDWDCVWTLVEK